MSFLEVRNISKIIRCEEVLKDMSFSVDRGQVVGLEGRNGSGKTMAMRAVCGLIRLDAGEIEVDGKVLWRDTSFPPSVGLMLEGPALLSGRTAFDNMRLLASIKGVASDDQLRATLERVGLDPNLRKAVRAYSLGMRQRLGLAMALMEQPDLVVLDEPTNALDEAAQAELITMVKDERDRGAAVLLSSHDAEFLRAACDKIYRLSSGKITGEEVIGHGQ